MYLVGYGGKTKTWEELQQWSQWKKLHPSLQPRVKWLLDASKADGSPLGIGGIWRSEATQELGFYQRHNEVLVGGCCTYKGKRYAKKPNVAHMAPPKKSFHEDTLPLLVSCAIDFQGNLNWLDANTHRVDMHTFAKVNNEKWHAQALRQIGGAVFPNGKTIGRSYTIPLITLPPIGEQKPTIVDAPLPRLAYGRRNSVPETRELQLACNFWKWRDANGQALIVDGNFGRKTESAVKNMQRALGFTEDWVDGDYGSASYKKLTDFLVAAAK